MEDSPFWTPCSRGGMMAAWTSLFTVIRHTLVPGLPLIPSTPGQEGTGQVLVRQSQNHHHWAELLAEGRTASHQSPEAERVPQCFHPLLFPTLQTGHGGNLLCQLTVPVTALVGMQGYIMTSVHTSFIFALKKVRVPRLKCQQDKPVIHKLESENPTFSHNCASRKPSLQILHCL